MFSLKDKTVSEYIDHVYRSMEYYLNLTDEQKKLIKQYKGMYYEKMNGALLGNPIRVSIFNDTAMENLKKLGDDIREMASIIMNAPKTENEMQVYRGQRMPVVVHYDSKNKLIFENLNFLSTSIFKEVALDFVESTCCLYKIVIPKGTPLLVVFSSYKEVKTIEDLENLQVDYEAEMILPPGCIFSIDSKKEYTDKTISRTKNMNVKDLKDASHETFKDSVLNKRYQYNIPVDTRTMRLAEYSNPSKIPSSEDIYKSIRIDTYLEDIVSFVQTYKPSEEKAPQEEIPQEISKEEIVQGIPEDAPLESP